MSLFVCGDTHGDVDVRKLTSKFFDASELTKDDYVLICGDAGIVWDEGNYDKYIQRWYNEKPWTTLFIDGNHENHDALDRLPVEKWCGGKIHRISDSIIHLMRGQVFEIDNHSIFTMGGASSHDKLYRTEGVSWWGKEIPSLNEYMEANVNLANRGNEVEYIFTHCASTITQRKIAEWYEADSVTSYLNMVEDIKFKHWFFGHYHVDEMIDDTHTALYQKVVKLW